MHALCTFNTHSALHNYVAYNQNAHNSRFGQDFTLLPATHSRHTAVSSAMDDVDGFDMSRFEDILGAEYAAPKPPPRPTLRAAKPAEAAACAPAPRTCSKAAPAAVFGPFPGPPPPPPAAALVKPAAKAPQTDGRRTKGAAAAETTKTDGSDDDSSDSEASFAARLTGKVQASVSPTLPAAPPAKRVYHIKFSEKLPQLRVKHAVPAPFRYATAVCVLCVCTVFA